MDNKKSYFLFVFTFFSFIFILNAPLHASVNVNFADYRPLSVGSYWVLKDEFNQMYYHDITGTEIIDGKITTTPTYKLQ